MSKIDHSEIDSGKERLRQSIRTAILNTLKPPRYLTGSIWANTYGVLSKGVGADEGRFRSFGYQNGMLDAMTDQSIERVTIMKSAQVGYTRLLCHVIGFYISEDPSSILVVQPRDVDARGFSSDEISPMLRDTPELAEIVGEQKQKDARQTILKRNFRNGASLALIGGSAPNSFRRIKARVLAFDEVDGYDHNIGKGGDPIKLGTERTTSFWNRKIIAGSTPTLADTSRIAKLFEESDKRYYYIACPHCGHKQTLEWRNLQWNKTLDEEGNTIEHHPDTAHFVCKSERSCPIEEHHKKSLIDAGEWIAEKPFDGNAGFHISALYSLFPNASWPTLVREYLEAKRNPALMQTFYNLKLGLTYEEKGERIETGTLLDRVEPFNGETLPERVLMLTAGVDVQQDRLEATVVAWAAGDEAFVIRTEVILGSPGDTGVWDALDVYLRKVFLKESGQRIRIRATCIDRNGGFAERVDNFVKDKVGRHVYSCFGSTAPSSQAWPKHSTTSKYNAKIYHVGVTQIKETLYAWLRIPPLDDLSRPRSNFIHFSDDCDEEYFEQLTAEYVDITTDKNGRTKRVWKKRRERNEALDCLVYAFAALRSTGKNLDQIKPLDDMAPPEIAPVPALVPPPMAMPLPKPIQARPQRPTPRRPSVWSK